MLTIDELSACDINAVISTCLEIAPVRMTIGQTCINEKGQSLIILGFFDGISKNYEYKDLLISYMKDHACCLYQDQERPEKMQIVKESILDLTPSLDLTKEQTLVASKHSIFTDVDVMKHLAKVIFE